MRKLFSQHTWVYPHYYWSTSQNKQRHTPTSSVVASASNYNPKSRQMPGSNEPTSINVNTVDFPHLLVQRDQATYIPPTHPWISQRRSGDADVHFLRDEKGEAQRTPWTAVLLYPVSSTPTCVVGRGKRKVSRMVCTMYRVRTRAVFTSTYDKDVGRRKFTI